MADSALAEVLCRNPGCPFGDAAGVPKVFVPGRAWSKYCSTKCRMAMSSERRRQDKALLTKLTGGLA